MRIVAGAHIMLCCMCRPPELLCLAVKTAAYGCEVDMWAVGCMLVEVVTGSRVWQGATSEDVLSRIQHICGRLPERVLHRTKAKDAYGHGMWHGRMCGDHFTCVCQSHLNGAYVQGQLFSTASGQIARTFAF